MTYRQALRDMMTAGSVFSKPVIPEINYAVIIHKYPTNSP
jgi:hypothetical protein